MKEQAKPTSLDAVRQFSRMNEASYEGIEKTISRFSRLFRVCERAVLKEIDDDFEDWRVNATLALDHFFIRALSGLRSRATMMRVNIGEQAQGKIRQHRAMYGDDKRYDFASIGYIETMSDWIINDSSHMRRFADRIDVIACAIEAIAMMEQGDLLSPVTGQECPESTKASFSHIMREIEEGVIEAYMAILEDN